VSAPVHATAVAAPGAGGLWRAVLITGRPGAGKSDLALRLLGRGWRLVGDDYVHLFGSGGRLWAAPPETIAGRMEVRGLGIVPAAGLRVARVVLGVELTTGEVERLPEAAFREFAGVSTPWLRLDPREASAVEKVATAVGRL
jgi:serine kinase of HPr protein (carbohydrate metabolism regulator)